MLLPYIMSKLTHQQVLLQLHQYHILYPIESAPITLQLQLILILQDFQENEIEPILVSLEFKDAPYYRFVEN